ncbi:MAG: O-methyltransferase [Ignavibacteria bacterium]|nr:O-methyltransferase [Ignavibacteria bacterium]MBI3764917.1 O-methyltransferase [Ignavibacteriales bacterium]
MDIVNAHIVDYLLNITPGRDEVLEDMEEYALARNFPIIGPLVGRLLYLLTKTTQAHRILELGSGFGYSAYWFAKALDKNGYVICTESDGDNAEHAQTYFHRAKIAPKIRYLVGDALKLIDEVDGQFDIIFNDVDKHQYPKAFRKAVPRLSKGGLLISDNVLWSGKILNHKPDADTAGILTYNRLIYSSKDLFSTIIPLRDGVSVSIKL